MTFRHGDYWKDADLPPYPWPSPFEVYGHPDGNVIPALAPGQPYPGEPYRECVIEGTWTRATVGGYPVCWPCYRLHGTMLGPMLDQLALKLTSGTRMAALKEGDA